MSFLEEKKDAQMLRNNKLAQADSDNLGMAWYKFTVYFGLFLSMVICAVQIISKFLDNPDEFIFIAIFNGALIVWNLFILQWLHDFKYKGIVNYFIFSYGLKLPLMLLLWAGMFLDYIKEMFDVLPLFYRYAFIIVLSIYTVTYFVCFILELKYWSKRAYLFDDSPKRLNNNKIIRCYSCGGEINRNATECPNCGAKCKKNISKKWWMWTIVGIVIIVLVSVVAVKSSNRNIAYEYVDLEVMVDELWEDSEKAGIKYEGKNIEFKGEIAHIYDGEESFYVDPLNPDERYLSGAICDVKNYEQKKILSEKSEGDTVVIRGKVKYVDLTLGYSIIIDEIY